MGFDLPEEKDEQIKAEEDMFTQLSAKSSVKLKRSTKGIISWEVKVVTGERGLIAGLIEEAIMAHKILEKKLLE